MIAVENMNLFLLNRPHKSNTIKERKNCYEF